MIEISEDFPGKVVTLNARGRITHGDYDNVRSELEDRMGNLKSVNVVYHFGPDFDADVGDGFWRDTLTAFRGSPEVNKLAVISDHRLIRLGIRVLGNRMSRTSRIYHEEDLSKAEDWIKEQD